MKKTLMALILGIATIGLSACSDNDKDQPISFEQLPQAAQTFINTYYADMPITMISREGSNAASAYDVHFATGHEVEFDAAGQWTEMEAPQGDEVPEAAVPTAVQNYVMSNYPSAMIVEISRETYGYKVELSTGQELTLTQADLTPPTL